MTHVIKNSDGDITHLFDRSGDWSPRSVSEVINDIESGVYFYATRARNFPDKPIHVVNDHGRYIRTDEVGTI